MRLPWLAIGAFAGGVDAFIMGGLLPAISSETGVSIAQAGYLAFIFAVTMAFVVPVLVAWFGVADRRKVLAGSAFVLGGGALMMALLPGFGALLAGRAVIAIGSGIYNAASQATAIALAPPDKRGKGASSVFIGTNLAIIVGVPLGLWAAGTWGWRTIYLFVAVLACVVALALLRTVPSGLAGERTSLRARFGILKLRGMPWVLATTAFFMVGGFMPFTYIATIAIDGIGLDGSLLSIVMLVYGLGAITGNFVGGRMSDRLGGRLTTAAATVIMIGAQLPLSAIPHLPQSTAGPAFLALVFLMAVGGWMCVLSQVIRVAKLAAAQAPLAISLNGTAINIGAALAAVAGGVTLDTLGPNGIGWISIFPLIVALGFLASQRAADPRPAASV